MQAVDTTAYNQTRTRRILTNART